MQSSLREQQHKKNAPSFVIALGAGVGVALGTAIGQAMGNGSLGAGIGTALGTAVGAILFRYLMKKNPSEPPKE